MNIIKIKDLQASEFGRLNTFLNKHPEKHVSQYFINMSLEEENDLWDVFNKTMKASEFKAKYKNCEVNIDGDSDKQVQPGWKYKALSLDISYNDAKTRTDNKSKQIIKARELTCITNEKPSAYAYEKLRFLSHFSNSTAREKIESYENTIVCINYEKFMSMVMSYFNRETHMDTFIKYVMYYLDILACDTSLELSLTKEYIATINKIVGF